MDNAGADNRRRVVVRRLDMAGQDLGVKRRRLTPDILELRQGGGGMADVLESREGERVADGIGEPQPVSTYPTAGVTWLGSAMKA
jgi:hypothetical protein